MGGGSRAGPFLYLPACFCKSGRLGFPELLGSSPPSEGPNRVSEFLGYTEEHRNSIFFRSIIDREEAQKSSRQPHRRARQVSRKPRESAETCTLSPVAVRLELELLHEAEKGARGPTCPGPALRSLTISSAEAKGTSTVILREKKITRRQLPTIVSF